MEFKFIGIDRTRQKVLFVQQRPQQFIVELIDLKTIKGSLLLHQNHTIKIDKKNCEILQKVELEISRWNGDKQMISFFDSNLTYFQEYEVKNAENWNRIIAESISFKPLIHSAA